MSMKMSADKSMVLCHWLHPACNYTKSSRLQHRHECGVISLKVFIARALNFVRGGKVWLHFTNTCYMSE